MKLCSVPPTGAGESGRQVRARSWARPRETASTCWAMEANPAQLSPRLGFSMLPRSKAQAAAQAAAPGSAGLWTEGWMVVWLLGGGSCGSVRPSLQT